MGFFDTLQNRFRKFFSSDSKNNSEDSDNVYAENREKIVAFAIALFISLGLWFIVNLSRDFNVTIQVPIQIANVPDDQVVSNDVPETASVNLSGEGWNIISVYNNPPRVLINAQDDNVNLSDQLRNQISAFSDLNILQVQPSQFTIETEASASKKVPIVNNIRLNIREQFGLLSEPEIIPDSVTVSGAESILAEIEQWPTEEVQLNDVNSDIREPVSLAQPESGMSLSTESVIFEADIEELTEAEVRVPIRTRNLPSGRAVTYNPSSVTVRFDVPLEQYSEIQGRRPFRAYVDYSVIEEDDSGRVSPEIEVVETDFFIRIRSFQPPRVSYFRIVPE